MKRIVSIPESNVDKFKKTIEKLRKLSKKLDGNVEYTFVKSEIKEIEKGNFSKYFVYEIEGGAPTLGGYTLVAQLERQGKGKKNLINHINKEMKLPEGLQERDGTCDHCHHNRARKWLFILQDSEGKMLQVGKSCVRDFTGAHQSPVAVANYYSILEDLERLEKEPGGSWYSYTDYSSTLDIVAFSIFFTDKHGYVKTGTDTKEIPSTNRRVLESLEDKEIRKDVETQGCFQKAEQVKAWAMSQEGDSDYILNLQALIVEEFVDIRKAGFLASAYSSYQRSMSQIEQKKVVKKASKHVGEIKKRQIFNLVFDRIVSFETAYGEMMIYFFHDEEGNVFVWKTGKWIEFEEKEKVNLKATLKAHDEYAGIKQNVITRCAVS